MGIIAVLLFTTGHLGADFYVPFWVILSAHAALGLGTMAGGWRIVKTMGMRITKLRPVGGFCAETAGAITLLGTAIAGIPVSTTQTISGSIMGVGRDSALLGRPLGRGGADPLGVDPDDSRVGDRGRRDLVSAAPRRRLILGDSAAPTRRVSIEPTGRARP